MWNGVEDTLRRLEENEGKGLNFPNYCISYALLLWTQMQKIKKVEVTSTIVPWIIGYTKLLSKCCFPQQMWKLVHTEGTIGRRYKKEVYY